MINIGYELNIERRSNWDDNKEESNISLNEWLTYAHADPELRLDKKDGKGYFEWIAYPESESVGFPWFYYYKGYICTKNPNLLVIRKLLAIANVLGAKVIGEEGEEYDQDFIESIS